MKNKRGFIDKGFLFTDVANNVNNAIDNKIVKEESVEHVQEKPQNP